MLGKTCQLTLAHMRATGKVAWPVSEQHVCLGHGSGSRDQLMAALGASWGRRWGESQAAPPAEYLVFSELESRLRNRSGKQDLCLSVFVMGLPTACFIRRLGASDSSRASFM